MTFGDIVSDCSSASDLMAISSSTLGDASKDGDETATADGIILAAAFDKSSVSAPWNR